jgi:fermentation-respiration switch protein FrsA (DUF1100 family)
VLYVISDPVGSSSSNATLPAPKNVTKEFTSSRGIRTIGTGTGEGHFHLSISTESYTGLMALSLSGSDSYNLTDPTVADTSGYNVYYFDGPSIDDSRSATVGVICGLVILGVLAVFLYKRRRNKVKAAQDITQVEAGPDAPANLGSNSAASSDPKTMQATPLPGVPSLTPAVQSIPPQPPTIILPMVPIAPIPQPQQQQTIQNQMQELGFSIHPRPTVAHVNTGKPWQPTPFVPPGSSQRVRAPELGEPTSVTGGTSTTA